MNPIFHGRTKYIKIYYHFASERVQNGTLDVRFVSLKDQIADIFTKSTLKDRFYLLRLKLNVIDHPLREGECWNCSSRNLVLRFLTY